MPSALANATLVWNNVAVAVVPNSITYREGTGEQTMRAQSAGGGSVQAVYSKNVEGNLSYLKFALYNTPENIELAADNKALDNANALSLTGDGGFSRTFNNMAITNDYEVNLGADTVIDIELMGDPAV
jgi:hypothetical protein